MCAATKNSYWEGWAAEGAIPWAAPECDIVAAGGRMPPLEAVSGTMNF